jgi:hypothetical protein
MRLQIGILLLQVVSILILLKYFFNLIYFATMYIF